MAEFKSLAIATPDDLIFGRASKPLTTRRGLVIGGGTVYPEVNFTLPPTEVSQENLTTIRAMYRDMVDGVCRRAVELESDGIVVEFETLIEMTTTPSMAIDLTAAMCEVLEDYYQKHGLRSAFRITPNDTRELVRPPFMRSGAHWDAMLETFEGCARAGAELLAIESTGGKEVHDDALMACDITQVLFALTAMGCADMAFLWKHIAGIADKNQYTRRRRYRLRIRQHRHGTRRKTLHSPRVRGGRPRYHRCPQPGRLRAGRGRAGQGLWLRESVSEGDHRLPHGHGRQIGGMCAFEPNGQCRCRDM